jgi:peptidoglycan/LPS O-acetylase OafA/YrhL
VVRFLGDASLSIYLYHRIFQLLARPLTDGWTDPLRILGQVAVGLGGASLLVFAGRRLLGAQRSRRLLGG